MDKYSRLVLDQANAMGMDAVPVVENDEPYASTDGSSIFVNPRFISQIETMAGEGGVRFIIAHELGHIRHGMAGGPESELDCDEFAARSIAVVGDDESVIPAVMDELPAESTETHPGSAQREQRAKAAYQKAEGVEMEPTKKEKRVTRFPRHH